MHTDIDQQTQDAACRLRQLPAELPPPYSWHEFRLRSRPARPTITWRYAALAAGLTAVVLAVAVWNRIDFTGPRGPQVRLTVGDPHALGRPAPEDSFDQTAPLQASAGSDVAVEAQAAGEPAIPSAHSRAIEHWLAGLPQEPAVVRVGTRAAVAGLEDQLAQVDDLLSSMRLDGAGRERLVPLQQERARLMGSLAQVRYAEVVDAQSSP